jgi:hypothetical protein
MTNIDTMMDLDDSELTAIEGGLCWSDALALVDQILWTNLANTEVGQALAHFCNG